MLVFLLHVTIELNNYALKFFKYMAYPVILQIFFFKSSLNPKRIL